MNKFEDRLINDLLEQHGPALATAGRPVSSRRGNRPLWITGGAVALAGATAIGVTLLGGGSAPAYAVTQNPNGSVTLSFKDVSGMNATDSKLAELGIPVRVEPMSTHCTAQVSLDSTQDLSHIALSQGPAGITTSAEHVPAGDTLVVGVLSPPTLNVPTVPPSGPQKGLLGLRAFLVHGDAPSCVHIAPTDPSIVFGIGVDRGKSHSQSPGTGH
jgi:hypothetical protein